MAGYSEERTMVDRVPLGSYAVAGGKHVDRVAVHHLTLPPSGKTGLHDHPCPVVSYVTEGSIIVEVAGEPPQTFVAGQIIFEPGNTRIQRFDNASNTAPATFVATYLLGAVDKELIHMIG
jgi:quercetin dioxygenase-like cupin family protein